MIRSLRILKPDLSSPRLLALRKGHATAMFWWGVIAVILQFFISGAVLKTIGLDISLKIHPASVLVFLCAAYSVVQGGVSLHQRMRDAPALMLFVFVIPLLVVYTTYFNGFTGSSFYIDSFWSAGLLTILLEPATDKQKRLLAKILIALCLFNVLVGLYESLTADNWFPFVFDDDAKQAAAKSADNFRSNAFYTHPLTASLITAMAVFLLYSMQIRFIFAAPIFGLLLVGLLEFGGRTALGVTMLVSALAGFYVLMSGIMRRNLKPDFVLAFISASIAVPILVIIITTQTTIADRIIDTLFYDDNGSSAARVAQWSAFNHLTLKNWLFGVPAVDLDSIRYRIGLTGVEDIENFWLLVFLNLGSIGFIVFLSVFGAFLVHLARNGAGLNAWLLMLSALVIDSSSNSLGTKSNDLFIEVAFLVALSGYRNYLRMPSIRRLRPLMLINQARRGLNVSGLPARRPSVIRALRSSPGS